MRRSFFLALALPVAAGAQGSLRLAPQYHSFDLKSDAGTTTVSQFAIPIAYVQPISSRLSFDIATAFASVSVKSGSDESKLSGLTDTQLRLNFAVGADVLVVTAGVNLPTGQYEVDQDKIAAAGQIGNDFLAFPISSFGNGLAGTGGVALARSLGTWNLGLGASFRKSAEFDAFKTETDALHFTPADEIRVRAGLDREAMGGRVMFGLVYSAFGEDKAGDGSAIPTTFATGDRLIGQAALDVPVGGAQVYLGGWMLHRAEGEQATGVGGTTQVAPPEDIFNATIAVGLNVGTLFLEPSIETRMSRVDGEKAGMLTYFGVRTRFEMGSLQISPSVAFGTGSFDATDTDITGLKGGVTIRMSR